MTQTIDRRRLELMLNRERARFAETHPRSARTYARAGECPFGGVPMTWMNKTAAFPLYLDGAGARRARVIENDAPRGSARTALRNPGVSCAGTMTPPPRPVVRPTAWAPEIGEPPDPGHVTALEARDGVLARQTTGHRSRPVELPAEQACVEVQSRLRIGLQRLHPAGNARWIPLALAHCPPPYATLRGTRRLLRGPVDKARDLALRDGEVRRDGRVDAERDDR